MTKAAPVPVWTWRDAIRKAKVAALTKHVCNMIANYVSDVGEGAFPSLKTLIQDTGMSKRAVLMHLRLATEAGLLHIDREEPGGDGRFKRCVYYPRFPDDTTLKRQAERISTPQNEAPDPDDDPPEDEEPGAPGAPGPPGARGAPGETPEPGARGAPNQVHVVHPELSIENYPNNKILPFPSKPEKDDRPDCVFEAGRIVLRNGLRAFWLERFDGDAERLELGLITAAAYVQPNSIRPLEAQVSAQLARQVADRRDRDRRYAAAAASRSRGETRVDAARAFLAKAGIEPEETAR